MKMSKENWKMGTMGTVIINFMYHFGWSTHPDIGLTIIVVVSVRVFLDEVIGGC